MSAGRGKRGDDPPLQPERAYEVWLLFEELAQNLIQRALLRTSPEHWRKRLGKGLGGMVSISDLMAALRRLAGDRDYIKELSDQLRDRFISAVDRGLPASEFAIRSWLRTVSWRVTLQATKRPLFHLLGPANDNALASDGVEEVVTVVEVRTIHRRLVDDEIVREAGLTEGETRAYLAWRDTDLDDAELAVHLGLSLCGAKVALSKARAKIAPHAAVRYEVSIQLFLVRRPKQKKEEEEEGEQKKDKKKEDKETETEKEETDGDDDDT